MKHLQPLIKGSKSAMKNGSISSKKVNSKRNYQPGEIPPIVRMTR